MHVAEFETHPVRDDRTLAQGDIAERPGMHQYGLAFNGLNQIGFDRFHQPGGHGPGHFQVRRGHGIAVAVQGQHHPPHTFAQIAQITGHGENGHNLRGHGNVKMRTHHETVVATAVALNADDHVAQGLGAEIHNPARAHPRGVHVQAAHARKTRQGGVVVIALVLHARGQGGHGQIVGRAHGMDVAGEIERIRRQRDALGQAAACGRALHAHSGAARGLADGRRGAQSAPGQPLDQADGGGGFALAQRRGRDGRDVHVFAVGPPGQAFQHGLLLDFTHIVPIGQQLRGFQAHFSGQGFHGLHA